MDLTLLVLAAGMGSRYGGLKQIDPVGPSGEIILDYSVFDAMRAGFNKVVFVIRKDIEEAFREKVGSRFRDKVSVDYVYQDINDLPQGFKAPPGREKPWGTGHAILTAAKAVNEPFAAINADDFYGRNGYRLIADYMSSKTAEKNKAERYCMTGFILRNTLSEHGSVARGVCRCDENGFLAEVNELTKIEKRGSGAVNTNEDGSRSELSGNEIVSLNMWGFMPSIFSHLESQFRDFLREKIDTPKAEFFIPSAVDTMIKNGEARLRVLETPDSWFGITYRDDKPRVERNIKKLVEQGEYPEKLF